MFGIDSTEFLVIVIIAVIVIGPKDLPRALYKVGQIVGKAQGMARHFRTGIDAMVREVELEELEKKWAEQNKRIMAEHPPETPVIEHAPASDTPSAVQDDKPPYVAEAPVAAVDAPPYVAEAAPPPVADKPPYVAEEPVAPKQGGCDGMIGDIDDSKAPLLDHLIELRSRLLKCVYALLVTGAICFYFSEQLFAILVHPLKEAFGDGGGKLVYTKLYEAFFVQIKIALFGAFCLSFPIIANQLWAFVAPGLYAKEKKALLPFIIATPFLFALGASLAYFVVMPTAFHFFLGYQGNGSGLQVEALPSADSYLGLVMQFILAFGICFLLPVLLMLLNRAGFVSREQLKGMRRYMIVGAFILAAVLTPPDVVSQLMLAIPLLLLYEITLVAIWFTDRSQAKRAAAEAAAEEVSA